MSTYQVAALSLLLSACLVGANDDDVEANQQLSVADLGLPCADPSVVSERNEHQTWFVYCTGFRRVWKTTDWRSFDNVRSSLSFDFGDLPALPRTTTTWWAPSVIYDAERSRYVMWVSAQDRNNETRSLLAFTATSPVGPWMSRGYGLRANSGQSIIDPLLFRNTNGKYFVYWKQYGGGLRSAIMGARLRDSVTRIESGTRTEIMNGYNPTGWEGRVRENPAVWRDPDTGAFHMMFSGGAWRDHTYATGHAVSKCGPLCINRSRGGWHITRAVDRDTPLVVEARGSLHFEFGGPGGAEFQGDTGGFVVYAAASNSLRGDKTRYLHRDRIRWTDGVPYVDNWKHRPRGFPPRSERLRVVTANIDFGLGPRKVRQDWRDYSRNADVVLMQEARDVELRDIIDTSVWAVRQDTSNAATRGSAIVVRRSVATVGGIGSLRLRTGVSASSCPDGGINTRYIANVRLELTSGATIRVASAHMPPKRCWGPVYDRMANAVVDFADSVNAPLIIGGDWNKLVKSDPNNIASRTGMLRRAPDGAIDGFFVRGMKTSAAKELAKTNSDHRPVQLHVIVD